MDTLQDTLDASKSVLLTHRSKQTEHILQFAKSLRELIKDLAHEDDTAIAGWLQEEIGASPHEASTYLALAREDEAFERVVKQGLLSLESVENLLTTRGDARVECLTRIERGELLDASKIKEIGMRHQDRVMTFAQSATIRVRSSIREASQAYGEGLRIQMQNTATDLLDLFDSFIARNVRWADDDGQEAMEDYVDTEAEGYAEAMLTIRKTAKKLRKQMGTIFGNRHADVVDVIDVAAEDDFAASLALTWHALETLESGRFGPFDVMRDNQDMRRLRQCVEFLGDRKTRSVAFTSVAAVPTVPSGHLRSLDVAAGVGAASLGLETAGFRPVAVHEFALNALALIRKNRPEWNMPDPSRNIDHQKEFAAYEKTGIDLVTAGRPLLAFEIDKADDISVEAVERFHRALHVVKTVIPRAFFFEVEDLAFAAGKKKCAKEIELGFESLGYELTRHEVSLSSLGIPQRGSRAVIVGFQPGLQKGFTLPVLPGRQAVDLVEAIGDLVKGHVWPDHSASFESWKKLCRGEIAPQFFSNGKRQVNAWEKLAIKAGAYAETFPWLNDTGGNPDGYFKLNTAMVKRLQGFPDTWTARGALTPQAVEFDQSCLPALSKYVGLAIYCALSGENLDIIGAMHESLVAPRFETRRVAARFGRRREDDFVRLQLPRPDADGVVRSIRPKPRFNPRDAYRNAWREYWETDKSDTGEDA